MIGTRATKEGEQGAPPERLLHLFEQTRRAALRARALDPGHNAPLDVELWTARNILERPLPNSLRSEIAAEVLSVYDILEESPLDARATERFDSLKLDLGHLLENVNMEAEAFKALADAGSSAGYYIRAQIALGDAFQNLGSDVQAVAAVERTRDYLMEHRSVIARDGKCLRLLLRTWWAAKTRSRFFGGERQPLPFTMDECRFCIQLIDDLMSTGEEYQDIQLRYLKAVLLWQVGEFDVAQRLWKDLQQDTDFSFGARRVIKSHVSTDAQGNPKEYYGTVMWVNPSGSRGGVW